MYVIVWEFVARPEKLDTFVAAYRDDGAWAALFAKADGYLGTELLRSTDGEGQSRFLTIDRWKTAEDFARFQERFSAEYTALDTELEGLTLSERKLGTYTIGP